MVCPRCLSFGSDPSSCSYSKAPKTLLCHMIPDNLTGSALHPEAGSKRQVILGRHLKGSHSRGTHLEISMYTEAPPLGMAGFMATQGPCQHPQEVTKAVDTKGQLCRLPNRLSCSYTTLAPTHWAGNIIVECPPYTILKAADPQWATEPPCLKLQQEHPGAFMGSKSARGQLRASQAPTLHARLGPRRWGEQQRKAGVLSSPPTAICC